ncbi:hypothetical protein Micbo1qcDRAFT_189492 [Microdochium bolleyi]|uniref:VWFA domain-containing protein n=1 Tax=Microdochium bolleyi TaxID=196109 RepID=A0A136IY21_9PEZI|nr:hypothetical protein Micbo1qcDRAFT_189492 [Microdochium bolleyi]
MDGAIVSVIPADKPSADIAASGHVPVDIVLVIDVSGSMGDAAPAPAGADDKTGAREDFGLSVLDLTKHAARTIMETLNESDRLAIITFSSRATTTAHNISSMTPVSTTNMWQGIMYGLDQFSDGSRTGAVPALMVLTDGQPNFGNPPKGYVNKLREMAPLPASIHTFGFGYQLDSCLLKSVAEVGSGNFSFIPDAGMIGTVFIHAVAHLQTTYATRCTLEITTPLSARLRTTNGTIINGTMDTEASAYSTPTHNVLKLDLGNLQFGQSRDIYLECRSRTGSAWTFDQAIAGSRKADPNFDPKTAVLSARLEYSFMKKEMQTVAAEKSLVRSLLRTQKKPMTVAMVAYHASRARVSAFLASFFKPDQHSGYSLACQSCDLPRRRDELARLIEWLPARQYLYASPASPEFSTPTMQLLRSLLADVEGQITIALSSEKYFGTWSMPYFASLSHAHSRQQCNSFKDPGLQNYNDNPFFRRCRDELDAAFERIEPPAPSLLASYGPPHGGGGGWRAVRLNGSSFAVPPPPFSSSGTGPPPAYTALAPAANHPGPSRRLNMAAYNDVDAGCFAGSTLVRLAAPARGGDGYGKEERREREVPISKVRRGMKVVTPLGARRVRWVLRTAVQDMALCRVGGGGREGGVLVTAWHPICIAPSPSISGSALASTGSASSEDTAEWVFPADVVACCRGEEDADGSVVRYTGGVYSLLLEPDADPRAHAIFVSGQRRPASSSGRRQSASDSVIWGVTLGHGLTTTTTTTTPDRQDDEHEVEDDGEEQGPAGRRDVRAHVFFGDYPAVEKALLSLAATAGNRRRRLVADRAAKNRSEHRGVVLSAGLLRDVHTGLVRGFRPL